MVAYLVRDYIGRRKIAGRLKFAFELAEERSIERELFVTGAVEGADRRAAGAAGGPHGIGIKNEFGLAIPCAVARENLLSGIFGASQNTGHELFDIVVLRGALSLR